MIVRDFFKEWHENRAIEVRKTTHINEGIYIQTHILPFFEKKGIENLEDITPNIIDQYVTTKLSEGRCDNKEGGLSVSSVRKHLSLMRLAFQKAVIKGYILLNPTREVVVKKCATTCDDDEWMGYDIEFVQNLLNALKNDFKTCNRNVLDIYPIVAISVFYGLRKEEVLGLKWSAIDFDKKTISIRHTVTKQDKVYCSDETKTKASRRKFALHPQAEELLRDVYESSVPWSEYVFAREDGEPQRPDCVLRSFQRALERHNLPKMRFHDLRHCTAIMLCELGFSPEEMRDYLGHSDIETTMNVYLCYKKRKVLKADIIGNAISI